MERVNFIVVVCVFKRDAQNLHQIELLCGIYLTRTNTAPLKIMQNATTLKTKILNCHCYIFVTIVLDRPSHVFLSPKTPSRLSILNNVPV